MFEIVILMFSLLKQALGKIINHDFTAEDQRFEMFMSPLASISDALAQRLMSNDPNVVHNEEVKVMFC